MEPGFPGPVVQNRAGFFTPGAGCPAGDPDVRPDGPDVRPDDSRSGLGLQNSICGRKLMISGAKFERFRGWNDGRSGGTLDPLETKQIHRSKSTKRHQNNRSQKKIGAIFGGEFSKLGKNTTKTS